MTIFAGALHLEHTDSFTLYQSCRPKRKARLVSANKVTLMKATNPLRNMRLWVFILYTSPRFGTGVPGRDARELLPIASRLRPNTLIESAAIWTSLIEKQIRMQILS